MFNDPRATTYWDAFFYIYRDFKSQRKHLISGSYSLDGARRCCLGWNDRDSEHGVVLLLPPVRAQPLREPCINDHCSALFSVLERMIAWH
jgi:hypothetical protein